MATIKELEKKVNELQTEVETLTGRLEVLSALSGKLLVMGETVNDLARSQENSNKRIQSDIQRIVERMQTNII
tara:strand:- start:213 stop:431 length:219 start_codon:yes stop_codon:yes gene_type:complete